MGIPQSRPKYSRSTFQTFQHKVQVKVTPAQSTLGQHSSPKYRSRLLGTDSSSPWYNRPTICTVSIPAHYTGHAYLTDPSHGTTGPQYTCSTFQPTVQVKSTGTDSSSLSIPAQCTGQAYLSDPARGTTAHTSPLYAPSTIRPSIQASLFVNWNYPTPKFDISHDEWRVFWTKYGRCESMQKVFCHCSHSCIKPCHPYFKSRELTIVPSLIDKVTADDIELAKRHDMDFSFLTLKDSE